MRDLQAPSQAPAHANSDSQPSRIFHLLAWKGVHVCFIAIFAVLLWNTLPQSLRKLESAVLAGTFLGCGSEFLQRFFPGRDPA